MRGSAPPEMGGPEEFMGRLPRAPGFTKMILRRPPWPLFRYSGSRPVEEITVEEITVEEITI